MANSSPHSRSPTLELLQARALEVARDPFYGVKRNGQFCFVNRAACEILGYTREELLSLTVADLDPNYPMDKWNSHWEELRTVGSLVAETKHRRRDGSLLPVEITITWVASGEEECLFTHARDISARAATEEALRQSEQRYRSLFETMAEGVVIQDGEGRILSANPAAERILGLSLEQMMGRTSLDPRWRTIRSNGSEFPGAEHPAMLALQTGKPVLDVLMGIFNPEENRYHWALVSAIPQFLTGSEAQPTQVFATITDITERKQALDQLQLSERRQRVVMRNFPAVVYQLDPEGQFLLSEGRGLEGLGLKPGQVVGLSAFDVYAGYPDLLARLRVGLSGKSSSGLTEVNGMIFDNFISPVFDDHGNLDSIIGIAADITEQKRGEEARRLSEAKFQQAFEQSPDAININRLIDGVYLEVNEGFLRTTGWSREEVIGRNSAEVGVWADPQERMNLAQHLEEHGEANDLEFTFCRKDGSHGTALMSARILESGGERWILSISRDISGRKEVERALQDSEASYRGLFDSVGEAIYIQDRSGRFVDVNQGAIKMYGYTREELIGRDPSLVSAPNVNDIPYVMGCLERAFAGEPQTFEFWGLRKNGEVFPKEVHLYPGTYFGQDVIIAMSTDITDRKRSETAQVQAQKLESLGVLAGGIAHDFNNLLTAIMGNLNLAQSQVGEYSPACPYLEKVEKTVLKAADLSRQMLAYSGKGHFVIKPRDLNAIVQEMTGLLAASLPKKIHLNLHLAPTLSMFKADGAQIQQVVMNLITNAADAVGGEDGRIDVTTYQADLDREVLTAGFPGQALEAGTYLVLSVADTGCGIDPSVLSRIFDPFFTTKTTGRGLGLSAMLGILKGHKAGIRIQTELGRGSTFEVFFPIVHTGEDQEELPASRRSLRMAGTVLLVDDEESILESTGPALESLGFRVVKAMDGLQALDRFQELGAELALVFMDLSMPRMDGTSAFLAMRHARPEVPVVLTSGYDQKEATEDLFAQGLAGFVQKPYRIQDLARELDRVLDGKSGH